MIRAMRSSSSTRVGRREKWGREVDFVAGKGTYSWHHKVVASVVGLQHIIPPSLDAADQRPTVEVRRQEEHGAVPEPGVVVTAKIRKVQPRMAVADVRCVGTRAVRENFEA
jgi:exosome complex component CSL4